MPLVVKLEQHSGNKTSKITKIGGNYQVNGHQDLCGKPPIKGKNRRLHQPNLHYNNGNTSIFFSSYLIHLRYTHYEELEKTFLTNTIPTNQERKPH